MSGRVEGGTVSRRKGFTDRQTITETMHKIGVRKWPYHGPEVAGGKNRERQRTTTSKKGKKRIFGKALNGLIYSRFKRNERNRRGSFPRYLSLGVKKGPK